MRSLASPHSAERGSGTRGKLRRLRRAGPWATQDKPVCKSHFLRGQRSASHC